MIFLIDEILVINNVNVNRHQKPNANITKTFPIYQSDNLCGVAQGQSSSKSSPSMTTKAKATTSHLLNVSSSSGNSIEYQQYTYEPKLCPASTVSLQNLSNPCNQSHQQQQDNAADNAAVCAGTGFNRNERGDNEETTLAPWECNMCTFLNHPDLNICECCDNVRIIPGMLRKRAFVNLLRDKNASTPINEVHQQHSHHTVKNSKHKTNNDHQKPNTASSKT